MAALKKCTDLTGSLGDVVFVGFPHDEGVAQNGGRIGAAEGPQVVRKYNHFSSFTIHLEDLFKRWGPS